MGSILLIAKKKRNFLKQNWEDKRERRNHSEYYFPSEMITEILEKGKQLDPKDSLWWVWVSQALLLVLQLYNTIIEIKGKLGTLLMLLNESLCLVPFLPLTRGLLQQLITIYLKENGNMVLPTFPYRWSLHQEWSSASVNYWQFAENTLQVMRSDCIWYIRLILKHYPADQESQEISGRKLDVLFCC